MFCKLKSEFGHQKLILSILGKLFFNILKLTKSLKRKRILNEGLENKFHSKIKKNVENLKKEEIYKSEKYEKLMEYINFEKVEEQNDYDKNKVFFDEEDELTKKEEGVKQILMDKFSKSIKEVQNINKKLLDIHETIQTFSSHVYDQEQKTFEILSNASMSLKNTGKANIELVKANDYNSTYGLYWAFFFGSLAFILLVFDYIKS